MVGLWCCTEELRGNVKKKKKLTENNLQQFDRDIASGDTNCTHESECSIMNKLIFING